MTEPASAGGSLARIDPVREGAPPRLPDLTRPLSAMVETPVDAAFLRQAGEAPDRIALIDAAGQWSYGALESASARLASRLVARGVAPGDVVVIVTDRNAMFICALLAVLRAGACFAILDDAYPEAQVLARLAVVRPKMVLLAGRARRFVASAGVEEPLALPADLESLVRSLAAEPALVPRLPTPEATAYLSFTSGSTGTPKCIATGHAPLPHFIEFHRRSFDLSSADQVSLLSGLSHDPLLRDIFTPLSIGATHHIPAQELLTDPSGLFGWLARAQITVCHLTPALGQVIDVGAEERQLPALRRMFWGGDVLRPAQAKRFAAIAPHAEQVNFYGTTETPQAVSYQRVDPNAPYPDGIPLGSGVADFELLVLDDQDQLAAVGQEGEVVLRSRYLSQGYFESPSETARRYSVNPHTGDAGDRFYRTGDRGSFLDDGSVRFRGRADDQVKVRGFRVELGEIAAALRVAKPEVVFDALALARPLPSGETQLAAFVVRRAGTAPTASELMQSVRAALPPYAHPGVVVVLDALPLLPNGKVDRGALLALAVSTGTGDAPPPSSEPLSERARELQTVWSNLLGVRDVGTKESFYDLGGDSLTALQVLVQMQALGLPAEIGRGILQGKTIDELAEEADAGVVSVDAPLPRDVQSRLLLNVLRGLLVSLLVLCHWGPPQLFRLPPSLQGHAKYVFLLLNWPTPGFAVAFGMTLGFVYAPMYGANAARVRTMLSRGALFVGAGTLIYAAIQLVVNRLAPDWYFHPFGGVLTYYTLAMLSAPAWLRVAASARRPFEKTLALSALCMLAHLAVRAIPFGATATYQLQPLLGKYSYLAMASGTLAGIAAGLSFKREGRVPSWFTPAGAGLLVSGVVLSASCGRLAIFAEEQQDVEIEKWLVYGGLLLLVVGPLDRYLVRLVAAGPRALTAVRLVATLGQLALPVCVFDFLARDAGKLLELAGARGSVRLLTSGLAFLLLAGLLVRKMYALYYGPPAARVEAAAAS